MFPALYHAHHNRHLEDIPFWLALAAQLGSPVLELGCGTGRVLLPLIEAGYHALGLDCDLAMLKFLRETRQMANGIPPVVFAADLCRFHLAAHFPLIILACNTYSTLDANHRKACLGSAHAHLRAGGIFAASLPNPELLLRLPDRADDEYEESFCHPQTGNPVQVSSSWYRTADTFHLIWKYDHLFPDGSVNHLVNETIHFLAPAEVYFKEIKDSGFRLASVYGDFDRSAYGIESPSLVFLAAK